MKEEKSEGVGLYKTMGPVISRNGGKWFQFVLGILKNEADAEDAMQEAVRRVLARNRTFPSEDQLRMYLGRAIGNTAFEMYNRRKRDRMRNIPIQENTFLCREDSGPETGMEKTEEIDRKSKMLEHLEEGLRLLPPKQEEALRKIILEGDGRSMREIGQMHNIPYSTLRHRNKQGLQRMRRFLERAVDSIAV